MMIIKYESNIVMRVERNNELRIHVNPKGYLISYKRDSEYINPNILYS
jgi:hypothetical protein